MVGGCEGTARRTCVGSGRKAREAREEASGGCGAPQLAQAIVSSKGSAVAPKEPCQQLLSGGHQGNTVPLLTSGVYLFPGLYFRTRTAIRFPSSPKEIRSLGARVAEEVMSQWASGRGLHVLLSSSQGRRASVDVWGMGEKAAVWDKMPQEWWLLGSAMSVGGHG